MSLAIYRYAIVWEDGQHQNYDIIGTEEMARESFSAKWLKLHENNEFETAPQFMELWRADDPDGDALARYDFHLRAGDTNGKHE